MSNYFVVFENRIKNNIEKMVEKARFNRLVFRPHFKTHQNERVGQLFYNAGVDCITVSSLEMARFFMKSNWSDILIAFPLDINEINEIDQLAGQIRLTVLVNNPAHLQALSHLNNMVEFMVEIDVGYHRSGIDFKDVTNIIDLIKYGNRLPNAKFGGIMAHFGNSYIARDAAQVMGIGLRSMNRMVELADKLEKELQESIYISIGDTPTVSIMSHFPKIDEIRPGNFVYYDLQQILIGSCTLNDIGALMKCAIVSKNHETKQLVIHGGSVHFSKEVMVYLGVKSYGHVVEIDGDAWKLTGSYISSLSQEHGIIDCDLNEFAKYSIGDYIYVLPVHSCLTANLMKEKTIFV